jgi:anti-anti-sigma factor
MLTVTSERVDTTLTLIISGVLDYSTIFNFNEIIGDLNGIGRIVMDFSNMEFIDSTGIGSVLDVVHLGSENQVLLEFIGLNDAVREVFETIGVFQILETLRKEG